MNEEKTPEEMMAKAYIDLFEKLKYEKQTYPLYWRIISTILYLFDFHICPDEDPEDFE